MLRSVIKLVISSTLLCAAIAMSAQGQHAKNSGPTVGNKAILCMPGLVFRCNQFGCFCVRP